MLRGPVAVGKTTVGWVLLSKLGQTKGTIHLDKEWGEGERRSRGGSERYADLENREESILVLELAYGEPNLFGPNGTVNLGPSLGATRNPREWVDIIKRQGREVISFMIWDTWEHVQERLRSRGQEPSATLRALYDLYQKQEWIEFHTMADIREVRIDANGKSPIEIASDILSALVTSEVPLHILSASLRARP